MNSSQESKSIDGQTCTLDPLRIYTTCVSGLGIMLLLWSVSHVSSDLPSALLFVGLIAIAELTTSEAFAPQLLFSISSAVTFAALLLFGPLTAVLVAMASGLVSTLVTNWRQARSSRAPLLQRALFNMATFGLSVVAAGGVYLLSGGRVGEVALLSNLLPMVLAAAADEVVNAVLVVEAVSLQTGKPPLQIWRQNVSWATPMNLLSMVVGGGGLALGYQIAGILGLGVFFLPVPLTIYAYRLYVRQTKAQMARLEEIVAERIAALKEGNRRTETA